MGTKIHLVESTPDKPAVYGPGGVGGDVQVVTVEEVRGVIAVELEPGSRGTYSTKLRVDGEADSRYLHFSESTFSDKKLGDKLPPLRHGDRVSVTGYRFLSRGAPAFHADAVEVVK